MDGRIAVFQLQDYAPNRRWIGVRRAPTMWGILIDQAPHAVLDKATRFITDGRPSDIRLAAPVGHPCSEQNNRPNNLVIMLDGIDESKLELVEIVTGKTVQAMNPPTTSNAQWRVFYDSL
jgi:hypothetical protein